MCAHKLTHVPTRVIVSLALSLATRLQTFDRMNLAIKKSCVEGYPVRVVRSCKVRCVRVCVCVWL